MHRPSTTSGELDVAKRGTLPLKSSLRHTILPLTASWQESVPLEPSVTTFPSATVGELRGPENEPFPEAIPVTAGDSYSSFHTSLPLAASRQRRTSFFPSRAKT